MTWYFKLDGDSVDLTDLHELFKEQATLTQLQDGSRQLDMELEFHLDHVRDAVDAAEGLLAKLNAVARIVHGDHAKVRIGSVSCQSEPDRPPGWFFQHQYVVNGALASPDS